MLTTVLRLIGLWMLYKQSSIAVDPVVAGEVIKLFKELDHGRGGATGTWHGQRFRDNPYPWFQSTYNRVAEAVAPLQIDQWWFNCGEAGDEYLWHSHNPYKYSAVLYVQTPENSGGIEFRKHDEYVVFYPTAGDFIEFAGNLAHRVQTNNSNDFRISIAFNLK
jgi:hypothetical protein